MRLMNVSYGYKLYIADEDNGLWVTIPEGTPLSKKSVRDFLQDERRKTIVAYLTVKQFYKEITKSSMVLQTINHDSIREELYAAKSAILKIRRFLKSPDYWRDKVVQETLERPIQE